jgi:hypothetical protein
MYAKLLRRFKKGRKGSEVSTVTSCGGWNIIHLIFFQPRRQSRVSASGLESEGGGTSSDLNQALSLNHNSRPEVVQMSTGDDGNR